LDEIEDVINVEIEAMVWVSENVDERTNQMCGKSVGFSFMVWKLE
jgi:hypothetical protein